MVALMSAMNGTTGIMDANMKYKGELFLTAILITGLTILLLEYLL